MEVNTKSVLGIVGAAITLLLLPAIGVVYQFGEMNQTQVSLVQTLDKVDNSLDELDDSVHDLADQMHNNEVKQNNLEHTVETLQVDIKDLNKRLYSIH